MDQHLIFFCLVLSLTLLGVSHVRCDWQRPREFMKEQEIPGWYNSIIVAENVRYKMPLLNDLAYREIVKYTKFEKPIIDTMIALKRQADVMAAKERGQVSAQTSVQLRKAHAPRYCLHVNLNHVSGLSRDRPSPMDRILSYKPKTYGLALLIRGGKYARNYRRYYRRNRYGGRRRYGRAAVCNTWLCKVRRHRARALKIRRQYLARLAKRRRPRRPPYVSQYDMRQNWIKRYDIVGKGPLAQVYRTIKDCRAVMVKASSALDRISDIIGKDTRNLAITYKRRCSTISLRDLGEPKRFTCTRRYYVKCLKRYKALVRQFTKTAYKYKNTIINLARDCIKTEKISSALVTFFEEVKSERPELLEKYFTTV